MQIRTPLRSVCCTAAAWVAMLVAGTAWGADPAVVVKSELGETTPVAAFRSRLASMAKHTMTFEDVKANLGGRIAAKFAGCLKVQQPSAGVELNQWSEKQSGAGTMPIQWNQDQRKYEVLQEQFDKCSDAVIRFTWYYLRAYDGLDPALRSSHSTLATGIAALVAAEVVYRENWACLPNEVQKPAAVVNILLLYQRELLPACYGNRAEARAALVQEAVAAMCSVSAQHTEQGGPRKVFRPLHRNASCLYATPVETAYEGQPVQLMDLLPPHPAAVKVLLDKVGAADGISHLTLKGLILAATCPDRFGLPCFRQEASKAWQTELDALLGQLAEEMKKGRHGCRYLAPAFRPQAKEDEREQLCLRADPAMLCPLMIFATQIHAKDLPFPWKKKEVTGAEFLEAMKSVPAIQKVLALAGSDPIVEFYPRPKDASDSDPTLAKPGRLIWPHLVRLAPQGSVIREENLIVELVDYTFLGQGKPIRGVSVNAWVRVQRTDPQTSQPREDVIQAGKVEPGMKVRGFTHLGNVEWPMPVNLDGRQKEVWFNVLAKEVHQVPISLAIGLRGPSSSSEEKGASAAEPTGSPQGELITALDHAEFVGLGTKCAQGAWRRSWHLEPGMHLWAGSHQGDVDYLQQLHEPREIVEFSLGARDRSLNPNNFEVAPTKDASSGRVLVEARPTHAGPIDCNELILLANNKSLPIGDVQENPDVLEPKPDTTIIAGFYRRPDEDPWKNNPLVSRHATTTVKKTISKVTEAFALEFDNGTSLRLGPGNWVLEYDGQIREVFVDLEHLKPGMKIVAGLDERGEPATAALKSIRRILQPENNYVLLEAVNLPWASVNGIVVSVDFRDWHEGTVGLYGATHLARPALRTADLPRSASTDKAPAVPASDPQAPPSVASKPDSPSQMSSVVIAADPLVLPEEFKSPQDLVGQLLAIWDAALARLAPGVVGKIDTYLSTRTVVVSAAKGTTTYRLQCGPAQPLLVKLPGPVDSVSYQYAVDLRPGDRIFVGPPGASVAELWPVTGVRPMFYPGAALYDVVSPARQILHDSREGEADIGFGNSLAYALSVPVAGPRRARILRQPAQDGEGLGPGRTQGRQTGQSPYLRNVDRPPLVTPPEELLVDKIVLPANALDLLKQRSSDLLIAFDSERYKLPKTPVDSTAMAFWRQVFQNAPRPTAPETQPAAAAPPLPGDSDSAVDVAFDAWFRLLIHRRNFFLQEENTNTGYLTQVTALEVAMASWLAEAGATETADKLLLDLVELSIYAGCEHADSKRLQARMGKDLELPILLHVSNWVRRQQRASKQEVLMSVSNPALEAARTWADRQNLRATIVKPNGQLSLSGLYAYWASRGKDRTPFWYDILQPDAQGGLSVSPSAKDKGVTPDELRISKDFTTWLQRMTARLLRESPPPDPVGPRPVQVVDLENHDAAQKLGRQKEGGSP